MIERRSLLVLGFAGMVVPAAQANQQALDKAIAAFTGGRTARDGRVTLDISPLVENGNAVPVSVTVQSPMTAAEHVQRIAIFTRDNPQSDVAVFHLGPRNGRAQVATRMRLATSQPIVALAQMNDGSVWQQRVEVIVTLAACIEGG